MSRYCESLEDCCECGDMVSAEYQGGKSLEGRNGIRDDAETLSAVVALQECMFEPTNCHAKKRQVSEQDGEYYQATINSKLLRIEMDDDDNG